MIVKICLWNSCKSKFSNYMVSRIKRDIEHFDLKNIQIEESKCMWQCKDWPNAKINKQVINFCNGSKLSQNMFKKLKK